MADTRQKNKVWRVTNADGSINYEQATLATLMDIRDELQSINRFLGCYRIPRALDAVHELGVEARRRKRDAAAKRKAAKAKGRRP